MPKPWDHDQFVFPVRGSLMNPIHENLEGRLQRLARWMSEARRLVVFTGAGISTESGLPDFRGPDGVWTRRDKGLPPKPGVSDWSEVAPNEAHLAIVALQQMGRLDFLISQNVDNLHLKSGIRPDLLAELHGNVTLMRCRRCQRTQSRSEGPEQCPCGGALKSSVVHFGDPLPERDLTQAYARSRSCDLFIVVGSTLLVTPAADMPRVALEAGARLVIINEGGTPFDRAAHLRFAERAGLVLPRAVEALRASMRRSG
jgi:NAD-dependent SIR2 family protein deacetylase